MSRSFGRCDDAGTMKCGSWSQQQRRRLGARRLHIAILLQLITFAGIASYLLLVLRIHGDGVAVGSIGRIPDEPQNLASSSSKVKVIEVTDAAKGTGEATADGDEGDEPALEERRKDCPVPMRNAIGLYDTPAEKRKGLEDIILLVSSNFGHRSFLLNWCHFAKKQGLNYGIVAMDDQIHKLVGFDQAVLSSSAMPVEESKFQSKAFNAIACNKLSIVIEVMEKCDVDVVFSDVDNVFLGDPFQHDLGRLIKMDKYDYIYSVNGDASFSCFEGHFPKEANTGFHYFSRKSAVMKDVVGNTLENCRRPSNRLDDQTLFWREMHKQFRPNKGQGSGTRWEHCSSKSGYYDRPPEPQGNQEEPVRLCCLDPAHYFNGLMWTKWKSVEVIQEATKSMITCKEGKVEKLQLIGGWNSTEAERSASSTEIDAPVTNQPGSARPGPTPAITCNTCMNCRGGMPKIPGTSLSGRVVKKSSTFFSGNWGNVLSPYWAARAMAFLGGYAYEGRPFGSNTWMQHLPTKASASAPKNKSFQETCKKCGNYEYFHKGDCSNGWGAMGPIILEDTRAAILEYSKRAPQAENEAIWSFFNPDDWLVYNRCCVFGHPNHAPAAIQIYNQIPVDGKFRVFIMTGRREDRFGLCDDLVSASVDYIKHRNRDIDVTVLPTASSYVDFARLVFAPNVLISSVGSSWTLWSALLANNSTVRAIAPMWDTDLDSLQLPPTVQIVNVPALRNPKYSEEAAQLYGIAPGVEFSNSVSDREAVLRFFRSGTAAGGGRDSHSDSTIERNPSTGSSPDLTPALECLRKTKSVTVSQYPSDSFEHYSRIHQRLSTWTQQPNHRPHRAAGFDGPWIENRFISHFQPLIKSKDDLIHHFGPYIPLFVPWTDHWLKSHYKYPRALVNEMKVLLRKDALYIVVSQNDDGFVGRCSEFQDLQETYHITVLSAGGWGHVPIPLLKQPEKKSNTIHVAKREHLVSYVGSDGNAPDNLRKDMISLEKVHYYKGDSWRSVMTNSKFSLAPRGYGRTSYHLMEALQMGLIPIQVYIDQPWIPYEHILQNVTFAVTISELPGLILELSRKSDAQIERIEAQIERLEEFFTFDGVLNEIQKFMTDPLVSALRCDTLPPTSRSGWTKGNHKCS